MSSRHNIVMNMLCFITSVGELGVIVTRKVRERYVCFGPIPK